MDENNEAESSFDEGERVYLGFGNYVTFYPLPWGVQRRMEGEWETAFSARSSADIKDLKAWQTAAASILFASAQRGDPALTLDKFMDMVDSRNIAACFRALRVASGFKVVKAEAGAAVPGPTPAPRGDGSTLGSLPPPDGPLPIAMN